MNTIKTVLIIGQIAKLSGSARICLARHLLLGKLGALGAIGHFLLVLIRLALLRQFNLELVIRVDLLKFARGRGIVWFCAITVLIWIFMVNFNY